MMHFNMALKNIKKSFKDYSVYFLTLILGVAIFYVFNALDGQEAMLKLNSTQKQIMDLMNQFLSGVSIFVAIILGFLIIYASNFLIKKRKKEFGIYLTLGMSKKDVSKILLSETILIGIISLFVGLSLGLFLSQFMSLIVAKLFEVDMSKFEFVFSYKAMIKTIIYYLIIYLIVIIFNVFVVTKYKLINLINASKKSENIKIRNSLVSILIFIVSIFMLGYAYYLVLRKTFDIGLFGLSILLGIIGTFLFFFGVSGFILKIFQKNKKIYYKDLNIFTLKQIDSKISSTVFSMSIISILLFLTITLFSSVWSMNETLTKDLIYGAPADIQIIGLENKNIDEFLKKSNVFLKERVIFKTYLTDETAYKYFNFKNMNSYMSSRSIPVIKLSDYNKLMNLYKRDGLSLKNGEFILVTDYEALKKYYNESLAKGVKLNIGGKDYVNRNNKVVEGMIEMSGSKANMGLIVVPDNTNLSNSIQSIIYITGNYKGDKEKAEKGINVEYLNQDSYYQNTKIDIYTSCVGMGAMMIFIGFYLGGIFLITSAAILALKTLSDISYEKEKNIILKKIGASDENINKTLFDQTLIFFLIPLFVGIFHSIFGILFARKVLAVVSVSTSIISIIITAVFIILIYGIYFLVTYFTCKRIIK